MPKTKLKEIRGFLGQILGSLKMAVVLLSLLSVVLAAGTFFESYYSRTYAYHLVYGSLGFHFLLLFLAINILIAALNRLPPKKRLAGFYSSHVGLLLLLGGSLLTLIFGIDGSLTLNPGQFSNIVRLEEPALYAQVFSDANMAKNEGPDQMDLPRGVFAKNFKKAILKDESAPILLRRYLPYAKEKPIYQNVPSIAGSGLEFTLFAPQASQKGVLSSPPSQYPDTLAFGPLHLYNLGQVPQACDLSALQKQMLPDKSSWALFTAAGCYYFSDPAVSKRHGELPADIELTEVKVLQSQKSFRLEKSAQPYLFVPALSSWPLAERSLSGYPSKLVPDLQAPFRIINLAEVFAAKSVIFYIQTNQLYVAIHNPPLPLTIEKWDPARRNMPLPWMKLNLAIDTFNLHALPYRSYVSTKPTAGDKERLSAVALEANGHEYWLESSGEVLQIPLTRADGSPSVFEAFLGYKTFKLPWLFRLERFKMDKDPGTNNPATYESFVNLKHEEFETLENHHVYMNNPLKKGKYTLYQASYFPVGQDAFGSVLQVNYDPGRIPKYMGAGIIVFGTLLHFYLRRSRRASKLV